MAITYASFIIGLRMYLEETTGVTAVWRYPGYVPPKERPFIAVEFVNSVPQNPTKLNELITEDIFLNIANYSNNVVESAEVQAGIDEILRYHTIPLRDASGEEVGKFNVDRVIAVNNISTGTAVEDELSSHRIYTDLVVRLDHIKKRIKND